MNLPRHWRLKKQRYSLIGKVCTQCGTRFFSPRALCPECSKPPVPAYRANGNGRVYTRSLLLWALDGCEEFVPYTVQIAGIDEQTAATVRFPPQDQGPHIED